MFDFDFNPDRYGTNSLKWDCSKKELPMWVADMDFETAPAVKRAVQKRAEHGVYGYNIVPEEWYNAIIGWWEKRHSFTFNRLWLQFCTGIVPAISCLVKRLTNIGDNVAVITPAYDIFYHSIENAGRHVIECPLDYRDGEYTLNFDSLNRVLAHPLTTMLIFCNPHNPTGNIWTKREIERVGAMCKQHGVVVLSDEIHCDLTMPGYDYVPFASASEVCAQNSITCISASKAFNIAGLQTAAVVIPNQSLYEKAVRGLNSDEVAEPNCFAVDSVIAAFNEGGEWLDELRRYISENRRIAYYHLKENLPEVRAVKAYATYLVWIDCSAVTDNSDELCDFIADKTGLILSTGSQYRGNGNGFIRLNVACNREKLKDGLNRFVTGVKKYIKWKK